MNTENNQRLSYEEAESFIMSALPMYQKIGRPGLLKLDLSKTENLMEYLGHPHREFPCIHVAGTNGKGSVSHMMAAMFQANGYSVGLFTSPHLKDYRERIKINGQYIEKEYITDWVNLHRQYIGNEGLSFFEMSTGLAFDYFQTQKVDIAIIETGLGGRLDSTNVIDPLLSIITNIDYDHTDLLGDTLELIATEKAGIIKPHRPVLLGNVDSRLYGLFEDYAKEKFSEIHFSNKLYCEFKEIVDFRRSYLLDIDIWDQSGLLLDNIGPYQDHNVNTCLHALYMLMHSSDWNLDKAISLEGLANFTQLSQFRGRFEIISKQPLIIADAAHNAAGVQYLKEYFDKKSLHLHIVFGMVKGKDYESIFSQLPKDAHYYFCNMSVPRAMEASLIQEFATEYQLYGDVYESAVHALNEIESRVNESDVVLVFGSIFLIAEIM